MQPTAPAQHSNQTGPGTPTAPFMDVTPPRASNNEPMASATPELRAAPPEDNTTADGFITDISAKTATKPKKAKLPKKPKNPSNGTGMIIGSTVLAMIVLSAIAIFAYIQSN